MRRLIYVVVLSALAAVSLGACAHTGAIVAESATVDPRIVVLKGEAANFPLQSRFYNGIGISITSPDEYVIAFLCVVDEESVEIPIDTSLGSVWVRNVRQNSPAEAAGIRCGDVLRTIDGNAVETLSDIVDHITAAPEGSSFDLVILRLAADAPDDWDRAAEHAFIVRSTRLDRVMYPDNNDRGGSMRISGSDGSERMAHHSSFSEVSPGRFRSSCVFENDSTFPVTMYFKTVPLAGGDTSSAFSLETGEKRTFTYEWDVEDEGIPFWTSFGIQSTQYVAQDWLEQILENQPDYMQYVDERDGEHYLWNGNTVGCWLSERRAFYFFRREQENLPFLEPLR